MNIGKREQIVIGVISALGLIAGLHYYIFAPGVVNLAKAQGERDATMTQLKGMIRLNDPKKLDLFENQINQYLDNLDEGLKTLKVDQPEIFALPTLAKVEPKKGEPPFPPPIPTPPRANWKPGRGQTPWPTPLPPEKEPRRARQREIAMERAPQQLTMIMDEVAKLRAAQAAKHPELSFLDFRQAPPNMPPTQWSGWRVPTELPAEMQGGALADALKDIANYKGMVDMTAKSSNLLRTIQQNYNNFTYKIGLDMDFNTNLKKYGEFVPQIQKLFFVDLIMKRAASTPGGMIILSKQLTTADLCNYLDVNLDFVPLEGISESKAYFLYEELRNLNYMIEMAGKMGVKRITEVTLRGYGYLRFFPNLTAEQIEGSYPNPVTLSDDEQDGLMGPELPDGYTMNAAGQVLDAMGNPVDPNQVIALLHPEMLEPNDPLLNGLPPVTHSGSIVPKADELGYAIPIKMAYVATNTVGISYLYEILRDKPLAELHRLIMRSLSANWEILNPYYSVLSAPAEPNSNDLEITATFIFVPKLFNAIDDVKKMIKEIRGTSSTLAKAPGAPGAPAPAPAAPGTPAPGAPATPAPAK